jgi:hypothetical protein
MNFRFPENTVSPNGTYEIIYGYKEEFGMGGPYAGSIYLAFKDKPPMFIHNMCYGDLRWADDESCFYFFCLENRKLKAMQFLIALNELKMFIDIFDYAEFETTATKHGYSVNCKNWVKSANAYNEGLIICDTKDKNVEINIVLSPKINIIPKEGIEIISIGDEKEFVEKRVKGFSDNGNTQNMTYYTTYGFHITYDDKNLVESIEIMFDMHGVFELYGKNPYTTEIHEMVEILKAKNNGETNPIQEPEDYMFLELSLGIFRGSTPEKYQLFIEQYKKEEPENFKNGTPEWMLEEYEKTKNFQTLLIGKKDYFRNPIYFIKE